MGVIFMTLNRTVIVTLVLASLLVFEVNCIKFKCHKIYRNFQINNIITIVCSDKKGQFICADENFPDSKTGVNDKDGMSIADIVCCNKRNECQDPEKKSNADATNLGVLPWNSWRDLYKGQHGSTTRTCKDAVFRR